MARKATWDREETLAKARDLFWSRGYYATSMKDIEHALDLRPGSIYAAFGSKEALFLEALELYARNSADAFHRSLQQGTTFLGGIAAHVRGVGELCCSPGPNPACMLVKTILEIPDDSPALRARADEMLKRMEQAFVQAFTRAVEAGELAGDASPERLGRRLQAEIIGLRAYARRADSSEAVRELAGDIAREIEALSGKVQRA